MSELPLAQSDESLKLVIVDQSRDALSAARDEADRRLTEELNEGGKFKHFMNGIWKGNLAKNYYRAKYTQEAKESIEASQDVLLFNSDSTEKRSRAMESTIERFQGEYDELIHTDAGERRDTINETSEAVIEVKTLIKRYCEGDLSDENIVEEKNRLLQALRDSHGPEGMSKSIVTVDNIISIARSVKAAVEHGQSLDNTINSIKFISGEALNGVRSEAKYNSVEKVIDKLSQTKIGSLVGPNTIIAATTIAASLLKVGSHSVVGAVTKTILPGVGAGLWSGVRENKRMKDDRAQHLRESAQGEEFSVDSKRRAELEETQYDTVTANDLTEHLRSVGSDELLDGSQDALRAALEALAAVETRIKMSDRKKLDLITFTDATAVGDERLNLDITRAKLKVALDSRLTQDKRQELGLDTAKSISDLLSEQSETYAEILDKDITEKDKLFNKLKTRKVAKAAISGVISGVVFGLATQEITAAIDPTRSGLLEQLWDAKNTTVGDVEHQTILHGLVTGDQITNHIAPSGTYELGEFAGESEISVSSDHSLVDNSDGTFSLIDPNGNVSADHIAVNSDGTLSNESIQKLHELGMTVSDKSFTTEDVISSTTEVNADEYMDKHLAETVHVKRDFYFDNDTSVSDKNEMRLHWGGNNGVAADGGFEMSVARMTAEGSINGDNSIDWQQAAASGELKLAISATVDTQSQVFMVDISPDGSISIPEGSPAAEFFSNEDGKAVFHGAYAEVVHVASVDENGVEHIRPLATAVGDRNPGLIQDTVSETIKTHHAVYEITTSGYETTTEAFTEMAPVIPINSRQSIESTKERTENTVDNYYGYNGEGDISEREVVKMTNERSPRLKLDPESTLLPQEELNWYREELLKRRGADGLDQLEKAIEKSDELKDMAGDVETIVTIPVAAVQEADTIYGALSLYGAQSKESLKKSLVFLNLNWLDIAMSDEQKRNSIIKSRNEIERARKDFPDLKIAVVENEYRAEKAKETGGVIGYVAADLVDTVLLAIQKRMSSGVMKADHEVVLIRNDADPDGMSGRYLESYQRAINDPKNKDIDVFKGVTRFGVKWAEKYPGFAVASNFASALSVSLSRRGLPATGGANFALKASTLAAVGGLGVMERTGAGSDDGAIGRRIRLARWGVGVFPRGELSQSSILANGKTVPYRATAAHVYGATVDTNPSRLIPYYIQGASYSNAWGSDFSSGAGGYRDRAAGMKVVPEGKSEISNDWNMQFKGIEESITSELRWNGVEDCRRVLSIFFSHVPGAYVIKDEEASNGLYGHKSKFEFTDVGREYLMKRFERDGYGKTLRLNKYRNNSGRTGRSPLISHT